jgi:hypothetical protein
MTQTPATPDAGPAGIGGWLILPIIGLVVTLFRGLLTLLDVAGLGGMSDRLTQAQMIFVIGEIIGNFLVQFLLPLVLLVLVAQKKRSFPRLYIIWAVLAAVFLVGDLLLANILFREVFASGAAELLDRDTLRALFSTGILVVVWVPYMLNSRRVKNTFVN